MKALTIEFIPYFEIDKLTTQDRLQMLLDIVKQNKVVLLEGRLRKEEEGELIAKTMAMVNESFKGIELAVVSPNEQQDLALLQKIRAEFLNLLLGDRQGFTVIGPANIVKEIKKDPNKIQLLTSDFKEQKKKRRR
jgi:uncharacterized protein